MTKNDIRLPEILSPAGDSEKLAAALRFGADAVYLAGREFGMRGACDNFSPEELDAAAKLVHSRGKKLYLTVNTLPHGDEYPRLREFLKEISGFGIDGFIVADLGVLGLVRETIPDAPIHISTQASICSPAAARAYIALGAERLVLARELTLEEIRAIRDAIPDDVELEAFVHGSMCVSYSGRCMLSNMLTGRDANRGQCAQPCRWNYTLIEEKRPNEPIPVEQTDLGTFIMSSKDMCMLPHVGKLMEAGVSSFKIEGRVKSAYYTSVVTNAYRIAVDACAAFTAAGGKAGDFVPDPALMEELCSVSHREYCTGFFFSQPAADPQLVTRPGYVRDKAYLAVCPTDDFFENGSRPVLPENMEEENENGRAVLLVQRNKLRLGDPLEVLSPGRTGVRFRITEMRNTEGEPIDSTPHPAMKYFARIPVPVRPGDIIRAGDGE